MFLFSLYLQEYQKLLYTNVQGKVNTYPKMKSKYLEWKALYHVKTCKYWSAEIVRAAILKCSEKKAVLKSARETWWRPILPRCTACSLERYWSQAPSLTVFYNFFEMTTFISPVGQLYAAACWANMSTAWQYLNNNNSYGLVNAIMYDAHHCQ